MITITEIAAKAGVSPATVSKALRGSSDINKDTAARLVTLASEMGYIIGEKKTFLKKQCVGLLCPEIISNYYARIVSKLVQLFHERDVEVFTAVSNFSNEWEAALLKQMISMRMSAIICITEQSFLSPLIRESIALYNIPILQIAMNMESTVHDNICIDERVGVNLLINHLTQLGHKNIAFFGDQYSECRLFYFQEAMKAQGLSEKNVLLTQIRQWQAGYELAGELLGDRKKKDTTAIVAEYDDIALGAMRRFGEAGFKIPGDYSIAGFDDANYCRYLPVALTTVESHVEEMCDIAFEMVSKKIRDPGYRVIQHISIAPYLIFRESTAAPRGSTG
jgi:LacI family transcriptional regulator